MLKPGLGPGETLDTSEPFSKTVLPWEDVVRRSKEDPKGKEAWATVFSWPVEEQRRFFHLVGIARARRIKGTCTDFPPEAPDARLRFARYLVQTQRLREDLP